jgi:hypothetical protein
VERADAWRRDEGLQTLRMLLEAQGRETWSGRGDMVRVTVEKGEVFFWAEEGGDGAVGEVYHSVPENVDGR